MLALRRQNFCLPSVQNKTNLSDTNTSNISMPWFHLSHVLAASTRQSTTPSWLLCMFNLENYADQSSDCRQKIIGMRLGTMCFIFGMNGPKTLFQMHAPKHGLIITCKKLLELGKACCRFTCTSVGSTFAVMASFWCSSRGASTTHVGIKTSSVSQVRKSWNVAGSGSG